MKKIFLMSLTSLLFFGATPSMACVPGFIRIGDNDQVSANGIRIGTAFVSNSELNQNAMNGRKSYSLANGVTVTFLGSIGDSGGITEASYIIKTESGRERVFTVTSNYKGNGVMYRSMSRNEPSAILEIVGGCGGGKVIDTQEK